MSTKMISRAVISQQNPVTLALSTSAWLKGYTHSALGPVSLYFFSTKIDRRFNHMVNDISYNLDQKYVKNSLKTLDRNVKWLKSVNALDFVAGSGNDVSENAKELLVKLDVFTKIDKLPPAYDAAELESYLDQKYKILESILPYLEGTSTDFRRKHVITNPFIQYLYRLVGSNKQTIASPLLIRYFSLMVEITVDDLNPLIVDTFMAINARLEVEGASESERPDVMLKLLTRIIGIVDTERIDPLIQDLLLDSLCNDLLFHRNINELIQIVYHYYSRNVSVKRYPQRQPEGTKLLRTADHSSVVDFLVNRGDGYLDHFTQKIASYVFIMSNENIISTLYLLYKIGHTDENLFNKLIETVMYRFNTFSDDHLEVLASLLSSYKYMHTVKGIDLGETLYGEGCRMLTGMLRTHFETRLFSTKLTNMLDPLNALTLLTKGNSYFKELVLKKIDRSLMGQLDISEFGKLLLLLNNLRVSKSNESVSDLIYNYMRNNVLLAAEGTNNLSTNVIELISGDNGHTLRLLSRFLSKKRYNRILSTLLPAYLESCTDKADVSGILSLLEAYTRNSLYKFSTDSVNLLLTRLIDLTGTRVEGVEPGLRKCLVADSSIETPDATTNQIIICSKNPVTTFAENGLSVDLGRFLTLLESIECCNLSINNVYHLTDRVYAGLYTALRTTSRWKLSHIERLLNFMVNTRIVAEDLLELVLDYVYNYQIVSISAATDDSCPVSPDAVERASGKLNLFLLFLKCLTFLNSTVIPRSEALSVYSFIINQVNENADFSTLGPATDHLKELLLFERCNDPEFYGKLLSRLHPEQTDYYTDYSSLIRRNTGKLHLHLSERINGDFDSFAEVGGLTFDFYSPTLNRAVHILKKRHYYVAEGNELYLKHKPRLMLMVSQHMNIKLKLVPEHVIGTENFNPMC